MNSTTEKREAWLDVAKFLGIFCIYLGHYGAAAGKAYEFAFRFHVPLFFFLSGCSSNFDQETSVIRFIYKRFKRIMIPFYCFAALSIGINGIVHNNLTGGLFEQIKIVAKGCIRNSFCNPSLWFLSCLFVTESVFKLLKKVRNRCLILAITVALFVISECAMDPRPIVQPHFWYNMDSMLYYMVFYALGYLTFRYISLFFKKSTGRKSIALQSIFFALCLYAALLFDNRSLFVASNRVTSMLISVLQPCLLILFTLMVSWFLSGIPYFSKVGQETLYLCGNEWVIKTIAPFVLEAVGLQVNISTPLTAYLMTFGLLALNYKYVIPFEKLAVRAIFQKMSV